MVLRGCETSTAALVSLALLDIARLPELEVRDEAPSVGGVVVDFVEESDNALQGEREELRLTLVALPLAHAGSQPDPADSGLPPDPSALTSGPFLDLGEREADPSFAEPHGGQRIVETASELIDRPIADAESLGDLVGVEQRRGEAERVMRRPIGGVALAAWRETWGWVAGWAAIE